MALFDPHPALKVTAPYSPMVDGWIGDDWFSYGAFRQVMFPYFIGQITRRGRGSPIASQGYDDYATLLRAGSASRSEEHTSELQSLMRISYAVFCLKNKNQKNMLSDSI